MARKRQYTRSEVNAILQESEGRNSPVSNEPGHTLGLHVGADGLQVSDRLMNTLKSDAQHPLVMNAQGQISSEADHRAAWKARNPGMTTKDTKSYFTSMIDNHKQRSGAFLDRQQAINVARYMLNSKDGQAALGELDGGQARVSLNMSLNQLDMMGKDAWKMNFAEHGGSGGVTHLEDFSKAFLLVDRLAPDGIHIQTLYPIK